MSMTKSRVSQRQIRSLITKRKRLCRRSPKSSSKLKMRSRTRNKSLLLKSRSWEAIARSSLISRQFIMKRKSNMMLLFRTLITRRISLKRKLRTYSRTIKPRSPNTTLTTSKMKFMMHSWRELETRLSSSTLLTNVCQMNSRVTLNSLTLS
jgi:hypothetical protein